MRVQIIISVLAMTGAMAAPCTLLSESRPPWVGTWKLNLSKSNFMLGLPKNTTTTIEPWEGGLKYTVDAVTADGEERHIEWKAKFDRSDYPVTGNPDLDTNVVRLLNKHSYEVIGKRDGKIVSKTRNVISRDGMTRTATATRKNAQDTGGQTIKNVAVFDKQ